MELKFSNDTKFIKFWPLPAEILSATHHYPIHPGHYIPNIPDISVHPVHYIWNIPPALADHPGHFDVKNGLQEGKK